MKIKTPLASRAIVELKGYYPKYYFSYILYFIFFLAGIFLPSFILSIFIFFIQGESYQFWHSLSFVSLIIGVIFWICITLYSFDQLYNRKETLLEQFNAQLINLDSPLVEEYNLIQLNQRVANEFAVEALDIYLMPNELNLNSFSFGLEKKYSILVFSWGSLFHYTNDELEAVLYYHYSQILSGDTQYKTHFFVLLRSFHWFGNLSYFYYKKGAAYYQSKQVLFGLLAVIYAMLLSIIAYLYMPLHKFFALLTFDNGKTWDVIVKNKLKKRGIVNALMRALLFVDRGNFQHFYTVEIQNLCFIPNTNIEKNVYIRIKNLFFNSVEPVLTGQTVIDLDNHHKWTLKSDIQVLFFKTPNLKLAKNNPEWTLLTKLKNIPQTSLKEDFKRPLSQVLRDRQAQNLYFKKIFHTKIHFLKTMELILRFRQQPDYAYQEPMSQVVYQYLQPLDPRLYVEIYIQCCQKLSGLPRSIAQQYIVKFDKIIKENQCITLMDSLLLERAKGAWEVLLPAEPQEMRNIIKEIVQLIDSILQLYTDLDDEQLAFRETILDINFGYLCKDYPLSSDQYINFSEIFVKILGLHQRERLLILTIIESCLWRSKAMTQEALDVLALLYWRFGFEYHTVVERVYLQNQLRVS